MTLPKPITFTLMLITFCASSQSANAQLWRYLNDSPASEKAAELAVEREASSVRELPIIVYGDTLSYTIITYDIQSLDGKTYRVVTTQKPFTKILNISCGSDSLNVYDLMGVDSVHFLNKNLLQILYSPHGGSDDGFQNTLILCINKGKLCVAMQIESDHQFDGPGLWGEYYLTAKLTGQSEKDYQFSIKTNDRYYSKSKPSKNHNRNAWFTVRFNEQRKIFYNTYKYVDGQIGYPGSRKKLKRIKGTYPAIKLGSYEYYYIAGIWFAAGQVNDGKIYLLSDYD